MRIIDRNVDFYDYLQNVYKDDTFTFDRTDSFIVTKDMMCTYLQYGFHHRWNRLTDNHRYLLLQVCNTFWLFHVEITEFLDGYMDLPKSYTVKLLHTWKNYNKERCLIRLDIISFGWQVLQYVLDGSYFKKDFSYEKLENNIQKFIQAVDNGQFDVKLSINRYEITHGSLGKSGPPKKTEKHIPLLIACGLGSCIDPLDMYLSIEEFFSLEKQSSERTESLGLTDVEKAENHGFDKKTSFRGKV